MILHYFPYVICLARTFSTMLNRSFKSWHLCLVPVFRGKLVSFSSLSMMLALHLSYKTFIMLRYVPPVCWDISSWNMFNFVKCYVCICWDDEMTFSFILLIWFIIYWFVYVETYLHLRDKSHLIMIHNPYNVLMNSVC